MPIICRCLHNKKQADKTTENTTTLKGKIIQFSPLCGCTFQCLKRVPLGKTDKASGEKENEMNMEKEKMEIKNEERERLERLFF
uniref:DUF5679 domain-containing protein n=1 Tax=Meloidogyne hapla TaxID=6305 RepID=A0A1I8BB63_MELHA